MYDPDIRLEYQDLMDRGAFEEAEMLASFAEPGGRSALRAGERIHPCPTCGEPDRLSAEDVRRGYQCDRCADIAEGRIVE